MRRRLPLVLLIGAVLGALSFSACSSTSGAQPEAVPTLVIIPYSTTGPVVVTAIDNHFHDIHPTDHRVVYPSQALVVKNAGSYRHNFTIVGTDVSVFLQPGDMASWPRIGKILRPGHYLVICKIHQNTGMRGEFTVASG
ncbi:MAG TPA: hypothetical protein VKA30_07675 [Actinomycetota bacterium]|nr:hypothetical protein [Actinomycetota bacterium]